MRTKPKLTGRARDLYTAELARWTLEKRGRKYAACHNGTACRTGTRAEAMAHLEMVERNTAERMRKLVLFEQVQDGTNWKLPTTPKVVGSETEAEELSEAIAFFCGGAEVSKVHAGYMVTSNGYYHYAGA